MTIRHIHTKPQTQIGKSELRKRQVNSADCMHFVVNARAASDVVGNATDINDKKAPVVVTGAFFRGLQLRIAGIAAVFVCFVGAEINVDDVSDSLDVYHLSHDLTAGVDSDHVVTGLDDRAGAPAAEESAATTTLARGGCPAEGRGF